MHTNTSPGTSYGLTETEIEADRNAAESRQPNTFADDEGEVYSAPVENGDVIALTGRTDHEVYAVRFFKEDALKIIALIAEAAK